MAKKLKTDSIDRMNKLNDLVAQDNKSREVTNLIPIAAIERNKDNFFNVGDSDESIEELAENIKENGLLHNIVVVETAPNKYLLISGERRTRAMELLGKDTIKATIKKDLSELQTLKLLFFANSETREYTIEEKINIVDRFIARIKEFENTDEKESAAKFKEYVAQAFNTGQRQAEKLISISTGLTSDLKSLLFNDSIDTNTAAALSQLPESYQHDAVNIIEDNLPDKKYAAEQALDFAKRAKNIISKTNTALAKVRASRIYKGSRLTQAQNELAQAIDDESKSKLEKDIARYDEAIKRLDQEIEFETQKQDNEVAKIFNNTMSSAKKNLDVIQKDDGEFAQAKLIARKVKEVETALKKLNQLKPTNDIVQMLTLLEHFKNELEI